ncbi:hypothetical protein AMECASPLE_021546 [Ameca splendens]|uniref:Uncharacterized protein n=1 Tax=Ameca splendens TaxID=208324 RepID=A0ABV0XGP3_9TELE
MTGISFPTEVYLSRLIFNQHPVLQFLHLSPVSADLVFQVKSTFFWTLQWQRAAMKRARILPDFVQPFPMFVKERSSGHLIAELGMNKDTTTSVSTLIFSF